jgi:glycosyltransferase involved in cell wall biosynthesis
MNVLFITTEPPFPPRNGARIPIANYIQGLDNHASIDLLLIDINDARLHDAASCAATEPKVRNFSILTAKRVNKIRAVLDELTGVTPYYGNMVLVPGQHLARFATNYDALIAAYPAASAFIPRSDLATHLKINGPKIAALSDIPSLVFKQLASSPNHPRDTLASRATRIAQATRSQILLRSEVQYLRHYDYHLVQSQAEERWISERCEQGISKRTVVLSNGVSEDLFDNKIQETSTRILFIGTLSTLYGCRLDWFLDNVWTEVRASNLNLKLTVVGAGANSDLIRKMEHLSVQYKPNVPALKDVYDQADVLVAPIFKGYGTINKVVEAMAAGCLVIGDKTAFNGIPGFVEGKHGIRADQPANFICALNACHNNTLPTLSLRQAARELALRHFRWGHRHERLHELLRTTPNHANDH